MTARLNNDVTEIPLAPCLFTMRNTLATGQLDEKMRNPMKRRQAPWKALQKFWKN